GEYSIPICSIYSPHLISISRFRIDHSSKATNNEWHFMTTILHSKFMFRSLIFAIHFYPITSQSFPHLCSSIVLLIERTEETIMYDRGRYQRHAEIYEYSDPVII